MKRFIEQVYRSPVDSEDIKRFSDLVQRTLDQGETFTESMLAGYTAVLCSPQFLYFKPILVHFPIMPFSGSLGLFSLEWPSGSRTSITGRRKEFAASRYLEDAS